MTTLLDKPKSLIARAPSSVALSEQITEMGRFCLQLEMVDGNEHLVALDKNGKAIIVAQGDKHNVSIPEEQQPLFEAEAKVVVHNHPNDATLSLEDMMVATVSGVQVWAVTKTGDYYFSDGFKAQKDSYLDRYALIQEALVKDLRRMVLFGGRDYLSDNQFTFITGHAVNLACRSAGFIDYRYQLSDNSNALYGSFKDIINDLAGFDLEVGRTK
jgi:hypothetical protein